MTIQFHREGFGHSAPAINIKHYGLDKNVTDAMRQELIALLGRVNAERTESDVIMDDTISGWWDFAREIAQKHYGPDTKIYSEGRSGGWLILDKVSFSRENVEWATSEHPMVENETDRQDLDDIKAAIATWEAFQTEILEHLKNAPDMFCDYYQSAIDRAKDDLAEAQREREAIVDEIYCACFGEEAPSPEQRGNLAWNDIDEILTNHFGPVKP